MADTTKSTTTTASSRAKSSAKATGPKAGGMNIDGSLVRELAELLTETNLTEIDRRIAKLSGPFRKEAGGWRDLAAAKIR